MGRARVLIIEDESIVALDIEETLKSLDYDVVGIEAFGEKALPAAQELRPDVVLMDVRLKGEMDGIQAAARIKDVQRLPIIFLTAHADESTLQRAKEVIPDGYILKPFEPRELHAVIEVVLGRGRQTVPFPQGPVLEGAEGAGIPSQDEISTILEKVAVIGQLPLQARQDIAASAVAKRLDVDQMIWEEGAGLEHGFVIASGRAAFIKTSQNGKELCVEMLAPGDSLPLLFALDFDRAPAGVRIQAPALAVYIPVRTLRLAIKEHPQTQQEAVRYLLNRLRDSHERARSLAYDSVEVRICSTLIRLIPQFARPRQNEESASIYLTRQELSEIAGTTTETAIRVTKNLERDGLLDLSRPGIIKLRDVARLGQFLALAEDK